MLTERIWILLARKLSQEASPAELAELEQLLEGQPDKGLSVRSLERWWAHRHSADADPPNPLELWNRIDAAKKPDQPAIWKREKINQRTVINDFHMIANYFKIAWRNITRRKGYSAINIVGLAIGIAACVLILQYVFFETGFEKFQANRDRVYRIEQDRYNNGVLSTQWAAGAFAVGNNFKDHIPEIEDYVKLVQNGTVVTDVDKQPMKIEQVFFASGSFFKLFTYPLIKGDKNTALQQPFTAALSETTARRVFGTTDIIGKRLDLNRNSVYTITGVYKDAPVNTQIRPDILLSYATFLSMNGPDNDPETAWQWDGCLTYVLLARNANPATVEAKMAAVTERMDGAELKQNNSAAVYHLQPLKDIHLYSHYMLEPASNSDAKTVYLLLAIAFFIVVIAWVNYINLATARAITRAKEVGVRKAVGSQRGQLIGQFLSESTLLNMMALVLALLLVVLAMPGFNRLSGQDLSLSLFKEGRFWLLLAALFIGGILLSGLYPAFVLSGFRPVEVLKGKMSGARQSGWLRKSLVVFQFSASLFLLIGTVTVYRQIGYMRQQSLGMNIGQTLVITKPTVGTDSTYPSKMIAFKQELERQSVSQHATVSTSIPGEEVAWNAGGIKLIGQNVNEEKQYRIIGTDYDYLNTFGVKLIAGRNFSREFPSDDSAVIFNKKGIEVLGFANPNDALNQRIDFWGRTYTIVGVTENFHQQSLHEAYDALIFRLIPGATGYVSVKINPAQLSRSVAVVGASWHQFFPGNTFDYFFLDDHFNAQYKADQRFGKVFGLFSILAILVACMGLFGLASFTTIQRTKEIGIRKVLGASVSSILRLLYREFALLLLISFVVATPLAWLITTRWLEGYAFRVELHWLYFLLPFLFMALIAILTVSFQSIKAAIANPVNNLRTE